MFWFQGWSKSSFLDLDKRVQVGEEESSEFLFINTGRNYKVVMVVKG